MWKPFLVGAALSLASVGAASAQHTAADCRAMSRAAYDIMMDRQQGRSFDRTLSESLRDHSIGTTQARLLTQRAFQSSAVRGYQAQNQIARTFQSNVLNSCLGGAVSGPTPVPLPTPRPPVVRPPSPSVEEILINRIIDELFDHDRDWRRDDWRDRRGRDRDFWDRHCRGRNDRDCRAWDRYRNDGDRRRGRGDGRGPDRRN